MNKQAYIDGVLSLLQDMATRTGTVEESQQVFAEGLGNLAEALIKSATVTVAAGIAVTTAGSASAQTGATTATGTGEIS